MLNPIMGQTINNFHKTFICFSNPHLLCGKSVTAKFYSPTTSFASFASLFISSPIKYAA